MNTSHYNQMVWCPTSEPRIRSEIIWHAFSLISAARQKQSTFFTCSVLLLSDVPFKWFLALIEDSLLVNSTQP